MRSLIPILLTLSVLLACSDESAKDASETTDTGADNAKVETAPANDAATATVDTTAGIIFSDPWIRLVPRVSPVSAAYVEITNASDNDVALTGISSPLAERIEMHSVTVDADETASMFKVDAIDIPAGETVSLAPSGQHIMIFGLKQQLEEGKVVSMLLSFDKQPPIPVNFTVQAR